MAKIQLTTFITAPVDRVFDLSRSINLHRISMDSTSETPIAGVISGLINENETVTWRAKHLFKYRIFTSKITMMIKPVQFTDMMTRGDFKSFTHEHHFKQVGNGTIMIDQIEFESPYGVIGRFVNKYYLIQYLEKLIVKRNAVIREYAESEKWKAILI